MHWTMQSPESDVVLASEEARDHVRRHADADRCNDVWDRAVLADLPFGPAVRARRHSRPVVDGSYEFTLMFGITEGEVLPRLPMRLAGRQSAAACSQPTS